MTSKPVRSVLFVCLGNICRSPLAEGVFADVLRANGIGDRMRLDSAGMGAWHVGSPPDPRSVDVARLYGIDISSQRARQIGAEDLRDFDLVLGMDRSNVAALRRLAPGDAQVHLFLEYATGQARDVPDPYYGDPDAGGFEEVYRMIRDASDRLLSKLGMRASAPSSGQVSSMT